MNRIIASLVGLCSLFLLWSDVARAEAPYSVAWSRQFGTTTVDESFDVAVDAAGNVYLTGQTFGNLGGPNAGRYDAFLTKYDGTGGLLWSRQLGTTSLDESYGVAVDAAGNAYISGYTGGSLSGPNAGFYDAFLTKYDGAGNLLWSRQIGTTLLEESLGVAVDATGHAFITGYTNGSLGGPKEGFDNDAFLIKYDGAGNLVWSRQIGTKGRDGSRDVAVDATGHAFITGYTNGSLGGPKTGLDDDAFLIKYDGEGNLLWSRQLGTPVNESSSGVAVDAAGNAYITGVGFGVGTDIDDAFLTKYDGAGNLLWSRQVVGTPFDAYTSGVAVDAAGNAYITGRTRGDPGGPSSGYIYAFLTKYDGAGNFLWSHQFGMTTAPESSGVAVDANGSVYITGSTYGSLAGPSIGSIDAFVVKFVVPEPSTYILAAAGLGFCIARRRRSWIFKARADFPIDGGSSGGRP